MEMSKLEIWKKRLAKPAPHDVQSFYEDAPTLIEELEYWKRVAEQAINVGEIYPIIVDGRVFMVSSGYGEREKSFEPHDNTDLAKALEER